MTDHGGQLDNVEGGSTVKLYVTTKYDVKYYLDDQYIEHPDWVNEDWYTTSGTMDKFLEDTADVNSPVTANNEYKALMDRDITLVPDTFKTDVMIRGGYATFSYHIYDYAHVIPIASAPTPALIAAMSGEGRHLISTQWELKDAKMTIRQLVDWDSDYLVYGPTNGEGNTVYAYLDAENEGLFEVDAPYTFHLYAYTDQMKLPETGGMGTTPSISRVSHCYRVRVCASMSASVAESASEASQKPKV